MTAADTSPALAGCDLSPLDSAACRPYLAWLLGENGADVPKEAGGLVWALAHCDDGVTWGCYDAEAKAWQLGDRVAPQISPPIRLQTLQELRIFGEPGEALIWRAEEGIRGRLLRETTPVSNRSDTSNPLRPSDESRILRGDRVVASGEHGFTHIGDRAGAEQVLPLTVTTKQLQAGQVRLLLRHYYESDAGTGAVRIAATRLVTLMLGGGHDA